MNPGEIYHVYNRGNNKEKIFKKEDNYQYFLKLFDKYLSRLVKVHAFCLMPNHFHFLVEVLDLKKFPTDPFNDNGKLKPVEKGFKNFFIAYAKAINKAYRRTGSLFQHKFKRKLVEQESHYRTNIAYIHYNPVKAYLCEKYEDWPYSSYPGFLGKATVSNLAKNEVLDFFGSFEEFEYYHQAYRKSREE